MKPTTRLALWLVLAADAMFFVGLLSASRVMAHGVSGRVLRMDALAVASLFVGRLSIRKKSIAASSAFVAGLFFLPAVLGFPAIEQLLHGVMLVHVIALIPVTLALSGEVTLIWEFVIGLGLILLASTM